MAEVNDDITIYYYVDKELQSEKIDDIKTGKRLKLVEGFLPPAGFVTADGTSYIVSWNKDCTKLSNSGVEDGKALKDIPASCIDGLFDINGHTRPNTFEKDVQSIKSAKISKCIAKLGDYCITTKAFLPDPTTSNCTEYKNEFPDIIHNCSTQTVLDKGGDRWVGALEYCKAQGGHLATHNEMVNILEKICKTKLYNYIYSTCDLQIDLIQKLGLEGVDEIAFFSSSETNATNSHNYHYSVTNKKAGMCHDGSRASNRFAICIGD